MTIIKIDKNKIDKEIISQLADFLQQGKVIVYPTETFYGLGCDSTNIIAVKKVYQIKGRSFNKPLPVIVASQAMLKTYFVINSAAKKLIKKYLPGPLSLVLNYNEHGKKIFKKSINQKSFDGGVRISSNEIATFLSKSLKKPITSTSANPSGRPSALDAPTVIKYFKNQKYQPDYIIDAGKLPKSKGSTFVDARDGEVKILRQGDLKIDDLRF
ncbi:MAG: L-threonylcarbamoyladenylate synthase [bacterium]|nr:L-threonylcarbamoyladenylate synthase [bacterium]